MSAKRSSITIVHGVRCQPDADQDPVGQTHPEHIDMNLNRRGLEIRVFSFSRQATSFESVRHLTNAPCS
jgi:hypothetical protein